VKRELCVKRELFEMREMDFATVGGIQIRALRSLQRPLNVEVFTCLDEARVLAADWRADYNANHPHSALGMMSPARFAASWQRIGNTNVPVNP
jgi:transposase InsO family protein